MASRSWEDKLRELELLVGAPATGQPTQHAQLPTSPAFRVTPSHNGKISVAADISPIRLIDQSPRLTSAPTVGAVENGEPAAVVDAQSIDEQLASPVLSEAGASSRQKRRSQRDTAVSISADQLLKTPEVVLRRIDALTESGRGGDGHSGSAGHDQAPTTSNQSAQQQQPVLLTGAVAQALADAVAQAVSRVETYQRKADEQDKVIARLRREMERAGIKDDAEIEALVAARAAAGVGSFTTDQGDGQSTHDNSDHAERPGQQSVNGSAQHDQFSPESPRSQASTTAGGTRSGQSSVTLRLGPNAVELLKQAGFGQNGQQQPSSPGNSSSSSGVVGSSSVDPLPVATTYPFSNTLVTAVALAHAGHPDRLCAETMTAGSLCRQLRVEVQLLRSVVEQLRTEHQRRVGAASETIAQLQRRVAMLEGQPDVDADYHRHDGGGGGRSAASSPQAGYHHHHPSQHHDQASPQQQQQQSDDAAGIHGDRDWYGSVGHGGGDRDAAEEDHDGGGGGTRFTRPGAPSSLAVPRTPGSPPSQPAAATTGIPRSARFAGTRAVSASSRAAQATGDTGAGNRSLRSALSAGPGGRTIAGQRRSASERLPARTPAGKTFLFTDGLHPPQATSPPTVLRRGEGLGAGVAMLLKQQHGAAAASAGMSDELRMAITGRASRGRSRGRKAAAPVVPAATSRAAASTSRPASAAQQQQQQAQPLRAAFGRTTKSPEPATTRQSTSSARSSPPGLASRGGGHGGQRGAAGTLSSTSASGGYSIEPQATEKELAYQRIRDYKLRSQAKAAAGLAPSTASAGGGGAADPVLAARLLRKRGMVASQPPSVGIRGSPGGSSPVASSSSPPRPFQMTNPMTRLQQLAPFRSSSLGLATSSSTRASSVVGADRTAGPTSRDSTTDTGFQVRVEDAAGGVTVISDHRAVHVESPPQHNKKQSFQPQALHQLQASDNARTGAASAASLPMDIPPSLRAMLDRMTAGKA